jgi:hypothetical protein
MAYNSSVQESTGFTPSMMMFGREMQLPIDLALGQPKSIERMSETEYASLLTDKLNLVHEVARKHILLASDSQKRVYDHRLMQTAFDVGDLVWLYNTQVKTGLSAKLSRRWTGPYTVTK